MPDVYKVTEGWLQERIADFIDSLNRGEWVEGTLKAIDLEAYFGRYTYAVELGATTAAGHPTVNVVILSDNPALEAEFRVIVEQVR